MRCISMWRVRQMLLPSIYLFFTLNHVARINYFMSQAIANCDFWGGTIIFTHIYTYGYMHHFWILWFFSYFLSGFWIRIPTFWILNYGIVLSMLWVRRKRKCVFERRNAKEQCPVHAFCCVSFNDMKSSILSFFRSTLTLEVKCVQTDLSFSFTATIKY